MTKKNDKTFAWQKMTQTDTIGSKTCFQPRGQAKISEIQQKFLTYKETK